MKGWTEEEIKNKNLMAPCGLYCGACGAYIATRDKNDKLKTALRSVTDQQIRVGPQQP